MAKKKPKQTYTNVYIDGSDEDGYSVFYTNLKGKKVSMELDAETYADAKFEASGLTDTPESEIGDA